MRALVVLRRSLAESFHAMFSAALASLLLVRLPPVFAASGGLRGGVQNASAAGSWAGNETSTELPEFDSSPWNSTRGNSTEAAPAADAKEPLEVALAEFAQNASEGPEVMAASEAEGQWHHRSHHHSHGGVMTLYHTTSPEVAELILKSEFQPGSSGWCGGAIYFTDKPFLKSTKFGPHTKTGAIIEAVVDMGRMAEMDRRCSAGFGRGISKASHHGYDSLRFNPGDGDEYVISSARRVLSMRRYK